MRRKTKADLYKQQLNNRILGFFGLLVLFILITPVKRSEVYVPSNDDSAFATDMIDYDLTESEKLRNAISIILQDNVRLEENNYPTTMTFKWTGGTLDVTPGKKAQHIAWVLWQYTGEPVSVTLEVGQEKYYGYYNLE